MIAVVAENVQRTQSQINQTLLADSAQWLAHDLMHAPPPPQAPHHLFHTITIRARSISLAPAYFVPIHTYTHTHPSIHTCIANGMSHIGPYTPHTTKTKKARTHTLDTANSPLLQCGHHVTVVIRPAGYQPSLWTGSQGQ